MTDSKAYGEVIDAAASDWEYQNFDWRAYQHWPFKDLDMVRHKLVPDAFKAGVEFARSSLLDEVREAGLWQAIEILDKHLMDEKSPGEYKYSTYEDARKLIMEHIPAKDGDTTNDK